MIEGYRKRRGWSAWNTAALGRFEFEQGYPSLESIQGIPERQTEEHRQTMLSHNVRLWAARLDRMRMAGNA